MEYKELGLHHRITFKGLITGKNWQANHYRLLITMNGWSGAIKEYLKSQ